MSQRIIVHEDYTPSGSHRVERTEEEVLDIMRVYWKTKLAPRGFPYDEKKLIADYMTINWAWYKDEEEL